MPNQNIQFNGQTLVIPGVAYADNVSAVQPANPALIPPMVFIAYGYGGKPFSAQTFPNGGGQALVDALRGAPSADFVPFISNPSTELFSASEVIYINCSENTQSTLILQDSTPKNIVFMTSADYGPPSNLLMAEVQSATTAGVMMTIFDGYTGINQASADNLGVPFQIAYTGASSGVTMTVTAVSGTGTAVPGGGTVMPTGTGATQLALSSPVSGESITVALGTGQYQTVGQLVAYLNTTSHYVAQVLPNVANGQMPTQFLDSQSATSLPSPVAGANQFVNCTAGIGGILYWVNQFAVSLASASGVIGGTYDVPVNIPLTHFAGAVAGPPTNSDYQSAFNAAALQSAWTVFADSNNPAVIAMGVQHAIDMSEPQNGRWRRFISGSSIGDTVTQAQTQARSMNAYQATYVYPGIWRTDTNTGNNTLYSGLHVAAAVASMMAGNQIAQPLTNVSLIGNGVEAQLSIGAGGQIDLLQQAGVMPIYIDPLSKEPTIVSDFTTWNNDNNPENTFNQQIGCRQALAYSLSQGLQPYIGTIASPYGLAKIKKAATRILNALIYSPGNNGILVSWDPKSMVITFDGTVGGGTVNFTVSVVFVGQVRFILETAFVLPLNLAA